MKGRVILAAAVATAAVSNAQPIVRCRTGNYAQICPPERQGPAFEPRLPCVLSAEQRRAAERMERSFVDRYPTEEHHRKAYRVKLDELAARTRLPTGSFEEALREHAAIAVELQFYKGKPVPETLQQRIRRNDATFLGLVDIFAVVEGDIVAAKTTYDTERRTLGRMWTPGAVQGSSACA